MTDHELSELIARHLEPAAMSANDYVQNWGPNRGTAYWRTRETDSMLQEYEWIPRDMVNDPAMTVMLLSSLRHKYQVTICTNSDGNVVVNVDVLVVVTGGFDMKPVVRLCAATDGRAVAEAYAKAEGLTR